MAHTLDETTACDVVDQPPAASTLDHAFQALLEPLRAALSRIESSLDGRDMHRAPAQPVASSAQRQAPPPSTDALSAQILPRLDALQMSITQLWERVTLALDAQTPDPSDSQQPVEPDVFLEQPMPWEHILLDDDLLTNPALTDGRRQFLQDVTEGEPAARILAGYLMIVRDAAQQDLPEMLRHVGEAYYRWHPRTSQTAEDPWEEALANWLNRLLERAGLPNSIQLVRPGERFDSTRHNAGSRGFEIVAVHGWVVLRDRTKVYTRANVTVK
jgi:hypothetical protein